jgi:hypothetical protein
MQGIARYIKEEQWMNGTKEESFLINDLTPSETF